VSDVKKIAILQSDYIPWKGYFDIIRAVDEFIVYDDVQFTKRDWRNRNTIKTRHGVKWLTIPVKVKGRYHQLISETEIEDNRWALKHWKTIRSNYEKCDFFTNYEKLFEETYKEASDCRLLSNVNVLFIRLVNSLLGIETKISHSADYFPEGGKSERLISICRNAGAEIYLTGPSGLDYLDTEKFRKEEIDIVVADYEGYLNYDQPFPPFSHNVSIVDLIFSTGGKAPSFLKNLI
jgi:hypothetical protein